MKIGHHGSTTRLKQMTLAAYQLKGEADFRWEATNGATWDSDLVSTSESHQLSITEYRTYCPIYSTRITKQYESFVNLALFILSWPNVPGITDDFIKITTISFPPISMFLGEIQKAQPASDSQSNLPHQADWWTKSTRQVRTHLMGIEPCHQNSTST